MSTPKLHAQLDHLVVMASSLAEGVAWAERVLGVTPAPGGKHPLMGTHNRLFSVASPTFPRAYLEIIALDPEARPTRAAELRRWFDMDDKLLQARVAQEGPQLIHFVVRVKGVHTAVKALAAIGLDRGAVLQESRLTPTGLLNWRITVRDDGQRLFYGGLPTLIQWGESSEDPAHAAHPSDTLPPCGVSLQALQVSHSRPEKLAEAYQAIGLQGIPLHTGAPRLVATLQTPHGPVTLAASHA